MRFEKTIDKAIDYIFLKKIFKLKLIDECQYKIIKEKIDNMYT